MERGCGRSRTQADPVPAVAAVANAHGEARHRRTHLGQVNLPLLLVVLVVDQPRRSPARARHRRRQLPDRRARLRRPVAVAPMSATVLAARAPGSSSPFGLPTGAALALADGGLAQRLLQLGGTSVPLSDPLVALSGQRRHPFAPGRTTPRRSATTTDSSSLVSSRFERDMSGTAQSASPTPCLHPCSSQVVDSAIQVLLRFCHDSVLCGEGGCTFPRAVHCPPLRAQRRSRAKATLSASRGTGRPPQNGGCLQNHADDPRLRRFRRGGARRLCCGVSGPSGDGRSRGSSQGNQRAGSRSDRRTPVQAGMSGCRDTLVASAHCCCLRRRRDR